MRDVLGNPREFRKGKGGLDEEKERESIVQALGHSGDLSDRAGQESGG